MTNPAQHDDLGLELDLDGPRTAKAEVAGPAPGVRIGGQFLELPRELPLDVLDPLTTVDVDVSYLLRQVLDARQGDGNQNEAILGALVDTMLASPQLPTQVVDAAKEMARRLFGEAGYSHLAQCRLTLPEIGRLAKFLGRRYGVGLGESSGSSGSSTSTGTTSNPTSSGSTDSTSGTSGDPRAIAG